MAFRTTLGWSLLTSGVVTLALAVLPGDAVWWGIGFLVVGTVTLLWRQF